MATKHVPKKSDSEQIAKDVRGLQEDLQRVEDDARQRDVTGPAEYLKRANRELERVQEYDREESPDE